MSDLLKARSVHRMSLPIPIVSALTLFDMHGGVLNLFFCCYYATDFVFVMFVVSCEPMQAGHLLVHDTLPIDLTVKVVFICEDYLDEQNV